MCVCVWREFLENYGRELGGGSLCRTGCVTRCDPPQVQGRCASIESDGCAVSLSQSTDAATQATTQDELRKFSSLFSCTLSGLDFCIIRSVNHFLSSAEEIYSWHLLSRTFHSALFSCCSVCLFPVSLPLVLPVCVFYFLLFSFLSVRPSFSA